MEARELAKDVETVTEAHTRENGPHSRRNPAPQSYKRASNVYLAAKRCFDIAFSLCAGIMAMIPLLILALIIVLKDFGNPFYFQKRVGQHGKDLWIVKLRSMKKNADDLESMLSPEKLKEYRREYKIDDDPRLIGWKKENDGLSCFGAVLRRTSMDEVPQIIWNILIKGNMSIIGPRPVLHDELQSNYTPEEQSILLSIKPGLTGYWQAYARNNATYETGERQRMELYYAQHRNVWLDIKILFTTIGAVLKKSGAK